MVKKFAIIGICVCVSIAIAGGIILVNKSGETEDEE